MLERSRNKENSMCELYSFIVRVLELEEGYRKKAYWCSEGYPTIGFGTKLSHKKHVPLGHYDALEVDMKSARSLLEARMSEYVEQLQEYDWFHEMNHSRQAIVVSMSYQLGVQGLLKFKKMIAAIEDHDWEEAANQMLDSRAARQTPNRYSRHAEVMRKGSMEGIYGGK